MLYLWHSRCPDVGLGRGPSTIFQIQAWPVMSSFPVHIRDGITSQVQKASLSPLSSSELDQVNYPQWHLWNEKKEDIGMDSSLNSLWNKMNRKTMWYSSVVFVSCQIWVFTFKCSDLQSSSVLNFSFRLPPFFAPRWGFSHSKFSQMNN